MRIVILPLLIFLYFSLSCSKDDNSPILVKKYLHLSHTRTNTNPSMDSLVEKTDFSSYDMLWLGGDLAQFTSADEETMTHIDTILNLGANETLWALGNHDYTDLERVSNYTNRPPYYATHKNNITFVVLDTQDSLSNIVGAQKELLYNVLDTISTSSHLIVLHHKLVWMYDNEVLESQASTVANGGFGDCFYCINPNNFNAEIYPKLVEVKQRGIEVLCIAGDIGFKAKEFEHLTPEGIHFLASGIDYREAENKALLFTHDVTNNKLEWNYEFISDL